MDFGLRGRVAVVTGAGKGIGQAISRTLGEEGASVVVTDVDATLASCTAEAITEGGGNAVAYALDVSDRAAVATVFATIAGAQGPVDILVNNAGIVRPVLFSELTDAAFDTVDRVNFRGALYCCQQVTEGMRARGYGRIVNIVSLVMKMIGRTDVLSYAASKAALGALTKVLAKDLGPAGVTVNAVLPGSIALTDFNDAVGYPKDIAPMPGMNVPLGRRGTPEDVAPVVAFLCSRQASYITGEFIDVNGGMLMD